MHYIAKYLTTYPIDRVCSSEMTDDSITRVPFIISAEGNIFILGKGFKGGSITFDYDKRFICPALHLNSGTIKILSGYRTKADTLTSKLSTIYPILIKQPSFFIPPPLRNYSISGHITLSICRFEPNLYEIVIQKMFPCDANDARFKPMRILSIITQVAKGLSYLHREGLIHGDVHPGNFLLDESDQVSFCLGVSIYQLLIGKNYFDDKPLITLTYERTFQDQSDCKEETLFGNEITQDEIDKQIDKRLLLFLIYIKIIKKEK